MRTPANPSTLRSQLRHHPSHRVSHRVPTADGWLITLYEYPAEPAGRAALPPVILCHGAFSRFHIFDWGRGQGLAPYLAAAGRRVFALDLRGRGSSQSRSPRKRAAQLWRHGWTIDDLLKYDVPAAIEFVLEQTGSAELDWVGHSMGGMLMLAHLSAEADRRVRRVVTVGSADFRILAEPARASTASAETTGAGAAGAEHKRAHKRVDLASLLGPLAARFPLIPIGPVMKALAVAAPYVPPRYKAAAYHAPNVELGVERRYLWHGFSTVSARKFRELIALEHPGGLSSYAHPTLFIAGSRDLLIPPGVVERTFSGVSSPEKQYLLFSKESGHSADYGHGDLLIGKQAPEEVFPHIQSWLSQPAESASRLEDVPPVVQASTTALSRPCQFALPHGITLAGDAFGDPAAPPVVLLHGGGQTRHAWGGAAQALGAAGFHAISLDLRGHGDSSFAQGGAYRTADFVRDVSALVDGAGTGSSILASKPALVGASLGGIASLLAQAALEPSGASTGCTALVLVDITPKLELAGIMRILEFMQARPGGFASLEDAADFVAEFLPHRPRPRDLSGLTKNLRIRADGRWHWHWDPELMRVWSGDYGGTEVEAEIHAERLQAARRLTLPALLIRGKQSDVVSMAGAQEFLEACPHAEFVDLSGAGHMVAGDSNDPFSAHVIEFLSRVVPRT